MTDVLVDEIRVDPHRARVFADGWQSWSPAAWYPAAASGIRPDGWPREEWKHLMRFRPGTPVAGERLQGEGVLLVDPGDGDQVRCYGAISPVEVPTLTASLEEGRVLVRADRQVVVHRAVDAATALAAYAAELADLAGRGTLRPPPTVWCSWYRYFEDVTADDVRADLQGFDDHDLRVDVVQIDDGWSTGLGEGLSVSEHFGSLEQLIDDIRARDRRPGLWLAPFLVGAHSSLALEHPDWVLGPAGHNWGDDLVGLDLTHPGVVDLLATTFTQLVGLGIDYLKLDFLYGGAVPGPRRAGTTPVEAYRSGLSLIREVVGPEVYLVGCGAPLLPSVGLVDAMRVSPDTFHEGGESGGQGLRGVMPLAARAWQHGHWWTNDPDCVVARPSYAHRERWAAAAAAFGGLRSFSDRLDELDDRGLEIVRDLLADGGSAAPFAPDTVQRGALTAAEELT